MRDGSTFRVELMTSNNGQSTGLDFEELRWQMVEYQVRRRGVSDERVLQAMLSVPRHEFVPFSQRDRAYEDHALPIGYSQTISQPYIVGYMIEQLRLQPNYRVLEIGTGSGYQAAVLARIVKEVYSLEIVDALAERAETDLLRLGFTNVFVRATDGYDGWLDRAPFDAIIVAAALDHAPQPLLDQLADGGRMIIPIRTWHGQHLVLFQKIGNEIRKEHLCGVVFVPFTRKTD
jgi:protein-L-isoaspartate(D-aspartate) O-methyltransferase